MVLGRDKRRNISLWERLEVWYDLR